MALFIPPNARATNSSGGTLSGAKWYFYASGTSTPATVYTTSARSVAHDHPVVADSGGKFAAIYLDPTVTYRAKLTDAAGNTLNDVDPYGTTLEAGDLSAAAGSGLVGHTQGAANAVARTVQAKLREFSSPEDQAGDDDTKWSRAISVGQTIWAQGDYEPDNTIFGNADINIVAPGATLSPQGAIWGFWSSGTTDESTATVNAGATRGSIQITVALADISKFLPNRYLYFTTDETGTAADAGATQYPIGWNRVIAADSGTGVVTLLRPLVATYPGVVTAHVVTSTAFSRNFKLRGLVVDGADSTHDAADSNGQAFRLQGYNEIDLDAESQNFTRNTLYVNPIYVYEAQRVRIRYKDTGIVSKSVSVNLVRVGDVSGNIEVDGSAFGVNISECDRVSNMSIRVTGRIKQENVAALTASLGTSTRGIKVTGVGELTDFGFHVQNCDTGLRVTGGVELNFSRGGTVVDCGATASSNGVNITNDVAYQATSLITECVSFGPLNVINQTGSCVAIESDVVRFRAVAGGRWHNCTKHAFYVGSANVKDIAVSGIQVSDWDTGGTAADNAAFHVPYGGSFTNLIFRHSSDATKPCFSSSMTAGRVYTFANIQRPDGNPMFPGNKDVETTGTATIASGATSIDVTHLLIKTPVAEEIHVSATNSPTNDPGHIWISNITSTQFRINCRSDPGAGGATFRWRAALKMPFTA